MVEVADTVDVAAFLLPNKLLNILLVSIYSEQNVEKWEEKGGKGDLGPELLSRSVFPSRRKRNFVFVLSLWKGGRSGEGRARTIWVLWFESCAR